MFQCEVRGVEICIWFTTLPDWVDAYKGNSGRPVIVQKISQNLMCWVKLGQETLLQNPREEFVKLLC